MLNAPANQAGTHNGISVPSHPSVRKTLYIGTMSTGNGIIMVARMTVNSVSRPFQWIRVSP